VLLEVKPRGIPRGETPDQDQGRERSSTVSLLIPAGSAVRRPRGNKIKTKGSYIEVHRLSPRIGNLGRDAK
jgi:hypothetical protein